MNDELPPVPPEGQKCGCDQHVIKFKKEGIFYYGDEYWTVWCLIGHLRKTTSMTVGFWDPYTYANSISEQINVLKNRITYLEKGRNHWISQFKKYAAHDGDCDSQDDVGWRVTGQLKCSCKLHDVYSGLKSTEEERKKDIEA